MSILKIIFFPFIFVWRLLTGLIKFLLITQVLIATLSLGAIAVLAYLFFHGDSATIKKIFSFFHH